MPAKSTAVGAALLLAALLAAPCPARADDVALLRQHADKSIEYSREELRPAVVYNRLRETPHDTQLRLRFERAPEYGALVAAAGRLAASSNAQHAVLGWAVLEKHVADLANAGLQRYFPSGAAYGGRDIGIHKLNTTRWRNSAELVRALASTGSPRALRSIDRVRELVRANKPRYHYGATVGELMVAYRKLGRRHDAVTEAARMVAAFSKRKPLYASSYPAPLLAQALETLRKAKVLPAYIPLDNLSGALRDVGDRGVLEREIARCRRFASPEPAKPSRVERARALLSTLRLHPSNLASLRKALDEPGAKVRLRQRKGKLVGFSVTGADGMRHSARKHRRGDISSASRDGTTAQGRHTPAGGTSFDISTMVRPDTVHIRHYLDSRPTPYQMTLRRPRRRPARQQRR